MAEADDNKSVPKRRIKNPETFREKALKAADQKDKAETKSAKPNIIARSIKSIGRIFSPIGKGYRRLEKVKQLKPVFKVLSFIGRIILPKYFRSSFQELKLVTWPSFKQSRQLTYAVLVFATIFGASVAIVDWGLSKIFRHLLLK